MIYCQTCGKSLHETARFCPHCGRQFSEEISTSVPASLWMAITALTLGIFTLILLLSAASDMETLSALGKIESAFGSHTIRNRFSEEVINSIVGGLVLGTPAAVFGILSLVQKRGGRGMAIASLVISGINVFVMLGLYGLTLN